MRKEDEKFLSELIGILKEHNVLSITVSNIGILEGLKKEFSDIVSIPSKFNKELYIIIRPKNINNVVLAREYYGFPEFTDYVIRLKNGEFIEIGEDDLRILNSELERVGRYDLLLKINE